MAGPLIAVVGSLHYDILVRADDRPRKGETLAGESWMWACGGKGGNQAAEAARHGAHVSFVGAVGRDAFGDALLAGLAAAGVDASEVRRIAGAGSGMSVALFDRDGDYGAVIVSGANAAISEADLAASAALDACRVLLLQNEVPPAVNLAAALRARARGATVILNAAPARAVGSDLMALIDILVVNEIEAAALSGGGALTDLADIAGAAGRLTLLGPAAIVTAGALGFGLCVPGAPPVAVAGYEVRVASTHGAGDAFVGAMAARLSQGDALALAAAYGNAAAATLVSTPEPERAALTAGDTRRRLGA